MKKIRIGLILAAIIILIAELIIIDYDNLFGSKDIGNYIVMLSVVLLIISQVLSIKNDRKKTAKMDHRS